jgi:hypothetical protein
MTANYVVRSANSFLTVRVTHEGSSNANFLVDDISIELLPVGAAMALPTDEVPNTTGFAFPADLSGAPSFEGGETLWPVQIEGMDDTRIGGEKNPTIVLRHGESSVAADANQMSVGQDLDGDGLEEISARFPVADLERMFEALPPGKTRVQVGLEMDPGTPQARRVPMTLEVERPQAVFAASFMPNPMRGQGVLRFSLTRQGPVRAHLYDALGRRVKTLIDEDSVKPGSFSLHVDGTDDRRNRLAAGVYFYRIEAREGVLRGRVALIK